MDAAAVNIQIFYSANEKFVIPAYQRRYSWEQKQCSELFEDILKLEETREHLLGMVIYQTLPQADGSNLSEIVDGQQRTTSISLLLKAIQIRLTELNSEGTQNHIITQIETFLYQFGIAGKKIKIQLGNMDNADFQSIINNPNNNRFEPQNPKIRSAYNYFFQRLSQMSANQINTFYYDLISNAIIIRIKIDTARNAYKLFEATNNRGKKLSDTDKIKNFLLGTVAEIAENNNNPELLSEAINYWTQIIRNIEDLPSEDEFLRHYLISKKRNVVSKSKITDEFELYFKNIINQEFEDDFEYPHQRILNDLRNLSAIYKNINSSGFTHNRAFINNLCDNLKSIKSTPSYSFLMNLYNPENGISNNAINTVSKLIETLMLRMHICKVQTGGTDAIFADLMNSFDHKHNEVEFLRSVKTRLQPHYPTDIQFKSALKEYDFTATLIGRARYILISLFGMGQGDFLELEIRDPSEVHVEHILPLNPDHDDNWSIQLGENYIDNYNKFKHKIGNLTLLAAPLNIIISNSVYSRKRPYLNSSNIDQTKEIARNIDNFDYASISNRSEEIAEQSITIWPYIQL